jgi:hypothetical protein
LSSPSVSRSPRSPSTSCMQPTLLMLRVCLRSKLRGRPHSNMRFSAPKLGLSMPSHDARGKGCKDAHDHGISPSAARLRTGTDLPQWLQTARRRKSAKQPRELWHARKQNVTLKRGITRGGSDEMLPSSHGTAREVAICSVVGCCKIKLKSQCRRTSPARRTRQADVSSRIPHGMAPDGMAWPSSAL